MRRILFLSLALMALLGFVAPPDLLAQAAAPQPKFTITGFIDNVGTWTQNMSISDLNVNRNRDHQMYGRTRGRFDIIGEVGSAKGVFGFEIDSYWGQTGFIDSNNGPGCASASSISTLQCGAVGNGAESSFDLNTDTQGNFQVKWLYVEFPLPLVPFSTIARLGGQPFATAANYKLATYANGDFPGVNLYTTFSPTFKLQMTYVAIDENLLGKGSAPFGPFANSLNAPGTATFNNKCQTATATLANCTPQSRGDNFALIGSPEITVMKGLDIKPMYSYAFFNGLTSGSARQGRGGVSTLAGGPFAPIASANANGSSGVGGNDGAGTGVHEYRHTVGLDARWRSGPFSLDPTILYQFGTQAKWLQDFAGVAACGAACSNPYGTVGTRKSADINAWLGDIRTSFQLGPLLLSHMVMWTTGQDAKSNPYKSIKYFTPLDTDTSYLADWGTQIMSLGVDYYQILCSNTAACGSNPGTAIGWDKYGRVSTGVKASYAITPALTVGAGITPNWTWNKVDTDAFVVAGSGLQPNFVCRKTLINCRPQGESNYLGTEFNAALTYRFAPGLVFDWAVGYLETGNAMSHRYIGGTYNAGANLPVRKDIGVEPIAISTARVRFSF
ncbi:MAG TPA: hypothetical protein VGV06_13230 [Methylomirabilota bacterium]|nr:hypothetical protein [Methylomirabilota bacterium]